MLQDKALLVKPSLSRFTPYKFDRNMSNTTAQAYGAESGSIRTTKRLVNCAEYKDIEKKDTEIRQFVYHNTRPWLDDGWRILATEMYFDVTEKLSKLFCERESFVALFVEKWPEIKAEAASSLGEAYNGDDFPDNVASRFSASLDFMPIPRMGDFRLENVSADDVARIEADTLRKIDDQFKPTDLWKRVYDAVERISDRLHAYGTDGNGKVVNKFHDTLIGNLRDLCDVLPKLNVSDDEALNAMHRRLEQELCFYDPSELRENEIARVDVASAADRILEEVKGWI